MPPILAAYNADVRAGDNGKIASMLALTAAFCCQRRVNRGAVPWVSGRVTLMMRVPPVPVCDPIFGTSSQRFAVDHHRRHDALYIAAFAGDVPLAFCDRTRRRG